MAFDAHVLAVLVASPGDTREERDAVERALHGWNADRAARELVAVSKVINERMTALGMRQGELVERSHVSKAIVRELQHNVVQRRRSTRTLEALSVALGWHPRHLTAVLYGRKPPEPGDPLDDDGEATPARLAAIEDRLTEIAERLEQINANLITVVDRVAPDRQRQ